MINENQISKIIVDSAIKIHRELGPGLFESVYEKVLAYELKQRGLEVKCQVLIQIRYLDMIFDEGFRADLIVNDKVIIELKSIKKLEIVHSKQLLTYLKLSDKKLGLLMNFNEELLKDGIKRIINGYI